LLQKYLSALPRIIFLSFFLPYFLSFFLSIFLPFFLSFFLLFLLFALLFLLGNFVDLVSKKWYDGMPLQKVEQLTVQTGKPVGGEGYTDPKTKQVRVEW
jgi:hypothetical protein